MLVWIEEAVTIRLNGNFSNWEEKCDRELYHRIVHNNLKIIASLGAHSLLEANTAYAKQPDSSEWFASPKDRF